MKGFDIISNRMNSQTIEVPENNSTQLESFGLILTVRQAFGKESDVVVGFPGLPNETRRLHTGDVILYEARSGTFDIRVLKQNSATVRFLVTKLSPTNIAGAFNAIHPGNSLFSAEELERVALSLENAKAKISANPAIKPEQIELINKKLDELKDASTRLGRKDWIAYAAGTISSTCVSAAFTPGVTKSIFESLNVAFSWTFTSALLMLQ